MEIRTPNESDILLMLQMLQMHFDDEYYKFYKELCQDEYEKRLLPEEYWLMSHGLMDEKGKFSSYKNLLKSHTKEFSNWFTQVIDIMFPVDHAGESSSDK